MQLPELATVIGRAMRQDRVTSLARTLARLNDAGALGDDAYFTPPAPGRYSRKLLWRDPAGRFVIAAMSWAPGQSSALHDHAGCWGAEVVVTGTMRETLFELTEHDANGRYRFSAKQSHLSPAGAVGAIVPPREYHTFANAGETVARTIHVYSGDLTGAQSFLADGGWYRAEPLRTAYDD